MKKILAITVGRSDFGIFLPVLKRIDSSELLEVVIAITGMHLSPEFGYTAAQVDASGLKVVAREEVLLSSDTSVGVAKSMALTIQAFAGVYEREKPDLILVLGDRFETFAATAAAVPFQIPIAHLHGGEITEGAMDDAFRHAITKMSHLHFTSAEPHTRRVIQLGEERWRVHTVGAPGLDHLLEFNPYSESEFEQIFGFPLPPEFLLATFHPVTTELEDAPTQLKAFMEGILESDLPCIITQANADMGGRWINSMIANYASEYPSFIVTPNLGSRGYLTAMSKCRAMVGNTSSGIIEAASFHTPVVNVGRRQHGRLHGANVLDVACTQEAITSGIQRVLSASFVAHCEGVSNPYGDGQASRRIVKILEDTDFAQLFPKRFEDLS